MSNPENKNDQQSLLKFLVDPSWWNNNIRFPGLTDALNPIRSLLEYLPKLFAVHYYKSSRSLLWVVILGGTGTGKSSIFNSLCRNQISKTGVERPKTNGPVAYAYKNTIPEEKLPPLITAISHLQMERGLQAQSGIPGSLLIIEHNKEEYKHMVLIDTPDLDSLAIQNRKMTENLYLLSDVVIFVSSQEKYADQVPFEYLNRIKQEDKNCFFILNKVEAANQENNLSSVSEEVYTTLKEQGIAFAKKQFFTFPYIEYNAQETLLNSSELQRFKDTFFPIFSENNTDCILQEERKRLLYILQQQTKSLLKMLKKENKAAQKWIEELDSILEQTCQHLVQRQKEKFDAKTREYIQSEIRKLFSRYDFLTGPRRIIGSVLKFPIRLLGMQNKKTRATHQTELWKAKQKVDLDTIQLSIDEFNRLAMERLMPKDETSPLFYNLQDPNLFLTRQEICDTALHEQDRLVSWLEERFQKLAQETSKGKAVGIYSTSILWGIMLLSVEIAIGGGITIIEAVLDSVLAPFMTKGAVEVFVYREVQNIAKEFAQKYKQSLYSLIQKQRDRYANHLENLKTPNEVLNILAKTNL